MLKFIDFIYGNIYHWYNRMKLSGKSVNPEGMTSIMFGLCFSGWLFLADWLHARFRTHNYSGDNYTLFLILAAFLFAGITNWFYSRNNRFQSVHDKHVQASILKKQKFQPLLSFLFIFSPFIITGIMWILFGV